MQKICFSLATAFLLAVHSLQAQDFFWKKNVVMSYTRFGIFTDRMADHNDNGLSVESHGMASGVYGCVAPAYGDPINLENGVKARLGWTVTCLVGYGQTKYPDGNHYRYWVPYTLDLGFNGGYCVSNLLEFGAQYCPIGIYGYSQYAVFGSHMDARIRVWHLQAELAREGDGLFRGCFVPRFHSPAIQTLTTLFLFSDYLQAGLRFSWFTQGSATVPQSLQNVKEIRFFAGFALPW